MVQDKGYASEQRKANWNEDPIGKLMPVLILHIMEGFPINQLPRSENVHFMCPDRTNVVEAKGEIEKKEEFRIHGVKLISSSLLSAVSVAHAMADRL